MKNKCNDIEIDQYKREIKSYVLRSRMTIRQQTGMDTFWASYGVELSLDKLDLVALFNRSAPVILEIGFGMGASLVELAEGHPELNFLGIEVHKPGVGAILSAINEKKLTNIRVICKDAVSVLKHHLVDNCLFGVLIFFPDPWPKRRHKKRRLIQPEFLDLLSQKLKVGGYLHFATDIEDYALHTEQMVASHSSFTILNNGELDPFSILKRPKTKFEQRGLRLGHIIKDSVFIKHS